MKIELIQTCSACPSQWEGRVVEGMGDELDGDMDVAGRPVYIRYRWGFLSVRLGKVDGDLWDAADGGEILGKQVGDKLHGEMEQEELATHLAEEEIWVNSWEAERLKRRDVELKGGNN